MRCTSCKEDCNRDAMRSIKGMFILFSRLRQFCLPSFSKALFRHVCPNRTPSCSHQPLPPPRSHPSTNHSNPHSHPVIRLQVSTDVSNIKYLLLFPDASNPTRQQRQLRDLPPLDRPCLELRRLLLRNPATVSERRVQQTRRHV